MRFPKAYKGIKKLIVAQAMMLITEIVSVVITFVLSDYYDFLENHITIMVILAFALLAFTGLSIVELILSVVGISQATKDEPSFSTALLFAIFGSVGIIVSVVTINNDTISNAGSIVSYVCQFISSFCVISGTIVLAQQIGDKKYIHDANISRIILSAMYILPTILSVFSRKSEAKNGPESTAVLVISVISSILALLAYLTYLVILTKAKKMLEADKEPVNNAVPAVEAPSSEENSES